MGYENYCDHRWLQDDMNSKVCLHCHERREVNGD